MKKSRDEWITREYLEAYFRYWPITGRFTRVVQPKKGPKKLFADTALAHGDTNNRYRTICVANKMLLAHRIVWIWHSRASIPAGMCIDHANGDGLDNRIENLRLATQLENTRNRRLCSRSSTGLKGVQIENRPGRPGWFKAKINVRGEGGVSKQKYLGSFPTAEEAHAAYVEAASKYHGEFANPG